MAALGEWRGRLSQTGIALPLVLSCLVVLFLVAGLMAETASLQFRMAGNYQSLVTAEQTVRAVAHELTESVDLSLTLPVKSTVCGLEDSRVTCDARALAQPAILKTWGVDGIQYSITRRFPAELRMDTVRESESRASSAQHNRFAVYEVEVSLHGGQKRRATTAIIRGVALRLPSGSGS